MDATRAVKRATPAHLKQSLRPALRWYGRRTADRRPLPDFLVIGAKRCGTQSFFQYLQQHPQVMRMWPAAENTKKTHYFTHHYARGEDWYRGHFPTVAARRRVERSAGAPAVSGEACQYYLFHPLAPERAAALVPDVRIIVLLRNPVVRAWSHYNERLKHHRETLPFLEALEAEQGRLAGEAERLAGEPTYRSTEHDWHSYLARGRYREQLERWHAHFPREQVLVLRSEDLFEQPQRDLDRTTQFLGLRPHEFRPHHFNRAQHPAPLPDDARAYLADALGPEVSALEDYLGRSFDWPL